MNKLLMAVAVALTVGATDAACAPDSLEVYRIEEVVVTATRIPLPVERLPLHADVVTSEQIALSYVNSSTDVLAGLPGVFIQRTGDFGRSDISVRGLGSNGRRITVLMDGHPVKMGIFGCTVTHALPLNGVERIELIRGPLSVLYGSDALGGVMNIITKSPPAGADARFATSLGTNSTRTFSLEHGADLGAVAYAISVDRRTSGGHLPNSAYEGDDFSAKVALDPAIADVTIYAKYFDGRNEEPALSTDPPGTVSDVWNEYRRGAFDVEIARSTPGGRMALKAYDEFGDHEFSDGWRSRDHSRGLVSSISSEFGEDLRFNGGVDFRQQTGKRLNDPPGQWSKYDVGSYLFSEIALSDALLASAGLRFSNDEISGRFWAPHAGLVLRPTDALSLRFSASRGFRSPQINELYLYPSSREDLKPERIWSYEAGLNARPAGWATADLTVFMMEGKDLIELVPFGSPPAFRFENSGRLRFRGVEAGLRLVPLAGLETKIAWSHLDPGDKTTGRPGVKLDAGTRLRARGSALAVDLQYVDAYYAGDMRQQRIDGYVVLDASLTVRVARGMEAFTAVKNLLDETYDIYTEIPGGRSGLYRMPGRRLAFGLTYTWERVAERDHGVM